MVNLRSKKLGDVLLLANGFVAIVLINILAANYFFRIDLTEEKRYSIKQPTKDILASLDDDVYLDVYLEGDLNAGFKRFQKSIRETLEEFRIYSGNKVHYTFIDPAAAMSQKARSEFMQELAAKGIQPTNVIDNKSGQRSEKIIFPGAVISYGGFESGVMLLKGNKATTPEEEINQSIEGAEYELANAIYKLVNTDRRRIGFVTGHGELDSLEVAAFNNALLEVYDVFKINLANKNAIENYDALVIAKPQAAFSEDDKYKLDQYIMHGGKALFLLDKLDASMDSASQQTYFAFPYNLNLDDQLFKYGIRINMDLVQDRTSGLYPVVTSETNGKPKLQLMEWPFFPLINHYGDHPITRNLDAVTTKFVSSIDTVKAVGIKKIPLMFTSQYSRTLTAPVNVSINELRKNVKPENYDKSSIPVAYLLEGKFKSLYKNRFLPEGADQKTFLGEGESSKLIVIADGDVARNDVNPRTRQPQALGYDPFTQYTFANQDLLMNALAFLTNENGLIAVRNKEVKIRPLDRDKIAQEKFMWRIINLVLPIILIAFFGVIKYFIRKKKYASF
jgi:gliding-associated putative ABC transporter substrate-binding component GldG